MIGENESIFLSFIIPIYNAEKYLEECLKSLIDQDIPLTDYEIICINDGSTDNSESVIRNFQKYTNILCINQKNAGVTSARNEGLKVAKGDFIWFIDADDFISRNILKELRESAKTKPDVVEVGCYTFSEKLSESQRKKYLNGELTINAYYGNSVIWTSVINRNFLNKNELFFRHPKIKYGEDTLFMYELSLCKPKKIIIKRPFYYYRRTENSAIAVINAESWLIRADSFLASSIVYQSYYEKTKDLECANRLMESLWREMYALANLPRRERGYRLKELKDRKLYPYTPPHFTLARSYATTRTDFVGKLFEKIWCNMHTRKGFLLMRIWISLVNTKKMLKALIKKMIYIKM